MLLKNEKQVDFTKNQEIEKSELKNILGRKETIVFRLVDKLSKPGPRGTKTYKRRHLIEAFYHTRDNNGNTSEYRYCKSKRPGKNFNETIYAPEMLTFENGGEIKINIGKDQKNNLDLLIFLLKHPRRASGPTAKNVENPLFFFIDENAQALQYIQKRELASDMDALLMNKNTRLSDEELIIIAEALAIPNVDEMNTARVQVEIQKRCKNKIVIFTRTLVAIEASPAPTPKFLHLKPNPNHNPHLVPLQPLSGTPRNLYRT